MKRYGKIDLKQGNKGFQREKYCKDTKKSKNINVKVMGLGGGVAYTRHRKDPFIQMTCEL